MGKNYFHQYLTFTKLFLNNFFITHCYRLFYFSKIRFLESRLTTRILQSKQFVVGTTYAFQNASVLDVRYSYSKIDAGKRPPLIGGESPFELYGITGLPDDPEANGGLTTQTIAGLSQLGRQATNPQFQNPTNQDLRASYGFALGSHSLKIGYEYLRVNTAVQDTNPLLIMRRNCTERKINLVTAGLGATLTNNRKE